MVRRYLTAAWILMLYACTGGQPSNRKSTLPEIQREAAARAASSDDPSAVESYLLYFPSSSQAESLRTRLVRLDAARVLSSRNPAEMTAFLRLHGTSDIAARVFQAYISFLLEQIDTHHRDADMVLFLRLCPGCKEAGRVRELLAMTRLKALGPSPSHRELVSLARTFPGTRAAALATRRAALLTADYAVLFGGPEAWLGQDWIRASSDVRREAARLALIHAIRNRDASLAVRALESLGKQNLATRLKKTARTHQIRILAGLVCHVPYQPGASYAALEVLLASFQDSVTKRDALETLVFLDDPRALFTIVQNVASSDLLVHVAAVTALKARLSRRLPWDRVATRLITARLNARVQIPPVALRLAFLKALAGDGTVPLPDTPTGQPVLGIIRAHLAALTGRGHDGLLKATERYFGILRRSFPQPIGRHNLSLALTQERTSAALLMLAESAGSEGTDLVTRIRDFRSIIVDELTRTLRLRGKEYTPSEGHPALTAYRKKAAMRQCPRIRLTRSDKTTAAAISSLLPSQRR